ncbi:MAG: hypothetical protein M1476_03355 [Candidatus Thermoplasmatota archaeon]|nr:hypothetical protein [Candidatus Thermoplasmatota archaeon]
MTENKRNETPLQRDNEKKEKPQRDPSMNRYTVLDCMSKKDTGKSITITLINGRTEAGILKEIGMFDIKIELPNKRDLIIFKHALITVSFS